MPADVAPARFDVELDIQGSRSSTSACAGDVRLLFEDASGSLEFRINRDATCIATQWSDGVCASSLNDVAALLIGPVMGYVLRAHGHACLHASVLQIGSQAVAFVGCKGAGKSTLAASLAQEGYPVLSDDAAAVSRSSAGWIVHPGSPRIRVTADTASALGLQLRELPLVMTGSDKRYVHLALEEPARGAWRFGTQSLPLRAIYSLEREANLRAPIIETVAGAERLTTAFAHASALFAPLTATQRAEDFARLGSVAASVPVRRLAVPNDLMGLGQVRDALLEDLGDLG